MKRIHIIGGGTLSPVRSHLALAAPAFGTLAQNMAKAMCSHPDLDGRAVHLHMTKMANVGSLPPEVKVSMLRPVTNEDVRVLVDGLVADPDTAMIFMTAAICDFDGQIGSERSAWKATRLMSRSGPVQMKLTPAEKVIQRIRSKNAKNPRKDIFLVGCKTTAGASEDEMFTLGLRMLKESSCNLVLVNDVVRQINMIVTPEQARYCVTGDRYLVTYELIGMALSRSRGTFTRSTVVKGDPVDWASPEVPYALRTVVDHCIAQGAYKDVLGTDRTVGHFAFKRHPGEFLTSRRNTNFNNLDKVGLVRVRPDGDDHVVALGSKPSVGGQSQRIIFQEHPDSDCIVHFHSPQRLGSVSRQLPRRNMSVGHTNAVRTPPTTCGRLPLGSRWSIWTIMAQTSCSTVTLTLRKSSVSSIKPLT